VGIVLKPARKNETVLDIGKGRWMLADERKSGFRSVALCCQQCGQLTFVLAEDVSEGTVLLIENGNCGHFTNPIVLLDWDRRNRDG